jgi:hypothetical protein
MRFHDVGWWDRHYAFRRFVTHAPSAPIRRELIEREYAPLLRRWNNGIRRDLAHVNLALRTHWS